MRIFGYATAAIVLATIALMLIWTAAGHATLEQCSDLIGEVIGIWFLPLLCIIVNKARGKRAGALTLVLTCLSWLTFAYHDVGPFLTGLDRGLGDAAHLSVYQRLRSGDQ